MKAVYLTLIAALLTVSAVTVTSCRSLFAPPVYTQAGALPGGTSLIPPPGTSSGKTPVQAVVEKQVWLFWISGLLCLLAAGALGYFGQYLAAVKVGLAGLILPIFATWWSQHYAIVIAAVLIGAAAWYILTHAAIRASILAELKKDLPGKL